MEEFVTRFLVRDLLVRSPVYLLCLAGLALALVRWPRHPKVSVLVCLGLGLLLLFSLALPVIYGVLPKVLGDQGRSVEEQMAVYSILGFVSSFVNAVALSLLVAAVFIDRRRPKGDEWFNEPMR